jgi:hypothetical protein
VDPALSEALDPMLGEIGHALRAMTSALVEPPADADQDPAG